MTRLELEAIAAVVLFVAGCIALYFYDAHEQKIGQAMLQAAVSQAAARAQAAAASETTRRVAAMQENVHATQVQLDAASAAAGAADRQRAALLVQLAAVRRRASSSDSGPPERGAADDPIGVLAEVLGSADDFAGRVAAEADANRIAGLACERAYDSLTH